MKIIHCSDIHLDSAIQTNLSAQQARERNREICKTFQRMVEYAENNGVEVILIAGDLFDTQRVTARTADLVLDTISAAADIDFLYLKGNHDESDNAFRARKLPDNLKLFSDEWTCFHYGNTAIYGIELNAKNCQSLYEGLNTSPDKINIVTMHGQVSSSAGAESVCLPLLKNKGIRYLALGHIHSYRKERLDLEGEYCYCGCLEGRGFDECGEKGFVLIDVTDNRLTTEFVPFAERRLYEVPVDITGMVSVNDMISAAKQASADIDKKHLVKYVLCGSFPENARKDILYMQKALESDRYFVKIKDESRLLINEADYSHDVSLKGEFVRTVMASDLSDEEKSQIILCGIQALDGEEITL